MQTTAVKWAMLSAYKCCYAVRQDLKAVNFTRIVCQNVDEG
jgi:hypothetical protein